MPRKYRPPAARRRKAKRPAPYFVEPSPPSTDGETAAAIQEEIVSAAEDVDELRAAAPAPTAAARAPDKVAPAGVRHIARDYSYVRTEVKRIVVVAGFLIVSLVITALLRN